MRRCAFLTLLLLVVALFGCSPKADSEPKPSGNDAGTMQVKDSGPTPHTGSVSVSGLVLDVQGERIAGASVQLDQRSVESGLNGEFSFGTIDVSAEQTVLVSHAGFATGRVVFETLAGVESYLKVTLQAAEQVMLEDATQGGEVTTESGAVLTLPPNSVVDADGNPVQGSVQVSVALINDRDEMAAAPPMEATNPEAASDAPPAELESFGMVAIDLTADGIPVHLAAGSTIEISFPMAANSPFQPGNPVGLWHFDETEQLWKSDGDGSVDENNTFHAIIDHLSWWNADQVLTKTCVRSRVLNASAEPIAGATITGEGRSYLGNTHATTDMEGNFCLEARVSSVIEVSALVRVGDQDQALAVHVNTARTPASCGQPADCFELPDPLVAVADQPLCQPSQCPQDPAGVKQVCCLTDLGPCDFVVQGDCGGADDGSWDVPSETPGVEQIPGVPMAELPGATDAGMDGGTDAGVDAGEPEPVDVPDAAADAAMDAAVEVPDASSPSCGPFFQGQCQECIEDNCDSLARGCFGADWQDGTFDGPCEDFAQCLCDSPTEDPSGCDPQIEGQACDSCMLPFDSCIKTQCDGLCGGGGGGGSGGSGGGGGNGGMDGGTNPEPVDRCSDLIPLSTLAAVQGSTLESTLLNDWYDDSICSLQLPGRGYLPGYERSYSISVPSGLSLRARVTGEGMTVLIAELCADIDGSCRSAGNTARWHNQTGSARTIFVTVDNTEIDARRPFTLYLSTGTAICGDMFVDESEDCDDGNTAAGDGCAAECDIEDGWSCPGDVPCRPVVCGDGIREDGLSSNATEHCDDGNTASEDGCDESCAIEHLWVCEEPNTPCRPVVCGDGIVDFQDEQCDDNNSEADDGCDESCQDEPGWTCPKNGGTCIQTICGDSLVGNPEQCDDGNSEAGDGCNANCQLDPGWYCPRLGATCRLIVCGDGMVDWPIEDCEDDNTAAGDGCSPVCNTEPGYLCDSAGSNCAARPTGDLCNNAEALPTGWFHQSYSLSGMSSDEPQCPSCAVTRWFSVLQQPGDITALRITADFDGYVSFANAACPQRGNGGTAQPSSGGSFGSHSGALPTVFNEGEAARTLWFLVAGDEPSGNFELTVKTGPRGCGDGLHEGYQAMSSVFPQEQCDDMNEVGGDGCSASCEIEPGYRCPFYGGGPCVRPVCGDGIVDYQQDGSDGQHNLMPAENCDDANNLGGDGCSSTCQMESGALCVGSPSICQLTEPGDQCTNALPLPLGPSTHSIAGFNGDIGCWDLCSGGTDLWFTRVLQPRELLSVEISATFEGDLRIFGAAPVGCLGRHEVGFGGGGSFGPAQTRHRDARNDGNTPMTVLVSVASMGATTGSFTLDVSAGVPNEEDCSNGPCQPIVCGDSERHGSEQCDDGAAIDGDGCSANCVLELGFECHGQPSECSLLPAGSTCAIAAPLANGSFSLVGYADDQTCAVSCSSPVRWFELDLPAQQTLVIHLSSVDIDHGRARVFDLRRGDCANLNGAQLSTLGFTPLSAAHGGWVNASDAIIPILIGIADFTGGDDHGSFDLQHTLAPIGCGDFWTDRFGQYGPVEQCDDGNLVAADGCSPTCITDADWDCQHGSCVPIVCGDGITSGVEQCDDSNLVAADGCSPTCGVEPGYVCGGTPSVCRQSQAGDQCETALALVDDSYSLTNYVPDLACVDLCSGPDRWFEISVPAGNTLAVLATSDMDQGAIMAFQIDGGCDHPMQAGYSPLGTQAPGSVFWTNNSGGPRQLAIAIADSEDPSAASFTLTHSLRPAGCGDFYPDFPGHQTSPEQCDDGNTASGDGCSSTCTIELGFVCHGMPSHCVVPPPGDICPTAQVLGDGSYGLGGYFPDADCNDICGGPDRWFSIAVGAGMLLNIEVSSSASYASADLFQRLAPDCSSLVPLAADSFGTGQSSHLLWKNAGSVPTTVVLALQDHAPQSSALFEVSYRATPAGCGDAYRDWGGQFGLVEDCDDGNLVSGDGCSTLCAVEPGYHCNAEDGEPSLCTTLCGDYQTTSNEACDDGNTGGGDGCSATCTVESGFDCTGQPSVCQGICGDGLNRGSEECDDGNSVASDGCSQNCQSEYGMICTGEPSVCGAVCGDGLLAASEACDDGNTVGGDNCSATCALE